MTFQIQPRARYIILGSQKVSVVRRRMKKELGAPSKDSVASIWLGSIGQALEEEYRQFEENVE